jgi:hypothetical protein
MALSMVMDDDPMCAGSARALRRHASPVPTLSFLGLFSPRTYFDRRRKRRADRTQIAVPGFGVEGRSRQRKDFSTTDKAPHAFEAEGVPRQIMPSLRAMMVKVGAEWGVTTNI